MNNLQRICIALGLLGIALLSIRMPYQTRIADSSSTIYEGYHFIWSPPDPVTTCVNKRLLQHYEVMAGGFDQRSRIYYARELCSTHPKMLQVALSATAVILITTAMLFVLGISGRGPTRDVAPFRKPSNVNEGSPIELQDDRTSNSPPDSKHARPDDAINWIAVNEFGGSTTYVDSSSIKREGSLIRAYVRYDLRPSGTDKRNNRSVQQMFMQEEYDLISNRFRVHQIDFIYEDGTHSDPLSIVPEWKDASDGNAKTLAALKHISAP